MRLSRLIALAVVAFGLFAFIWFYERKQPTTEQRKEQEGKLFPKLETEKVNDLVVHNAHGDFAFKKEGDTWKLVRPVADDANQGAVNGLVSQLAGLKAERVFPRAEVNLAAYGLENPQKWVEARDSAGTTYRVRFGNELPLGNTAAAVTDGSQVFLVSKWILADVDKDVAGWRSSELLSFFTSDVNAVTVVGPAGRWTAARSGNAWQLTEPLADLAEREEVEGVLSDLAGARIKEFLDQAPDLKGLGLDHPRFTVTLVRKEGAPLTLAFGAERDKDGAKQVACRRGERAFWVEASATTRLAKEPAAFRSAKLLQFSSWQVDKLEVSRGAQKVTVERKEGVWHGDKGEVDSGPVLSRLNTLAEIKVLAFDRPTPSGEPLGEVHVVGQEGLDASARFYPGSTAGEVLAVVKGRPQALAVDKVKVEEVLSAAEELAKPKATPTPAPTPAK